MAPSDEQRDAIDRRHELLTDIGQRINSSLGRLIVVMGLAVIVIVGGGGNDTGQVDVPVVGISLERWPAAYVLCVLAAALATYVVALYHNLTDLRLHLTDLREEVGWGPVQQIDLYPTLLTLRRGTTLETRLSQAIALLLVVLLIAPFPLVVYAGTRGGMSPFFGASLVLVGILSMATVLRAWTMVTRLESYFAGKR